VFSFSIVLFVCFLHDFLDMFDRIVCFSLCYFSPCGCVFGLENVILALKDDMFWTVYFPKHSGKMCKHSFCYSKILLFWSVFPWL